MTTGMTTFENIADAYIAAWNTRDAAERERAVAAAFAPGATYTDPLADVSGRDAITELIGGAQQQFAGWTFRLAGPVDGHHGQARFTWALGPDDGKEARHRSSASTSSPSTTPGQITSVLGFLDRVPTAGEAFRTFGHFDPVDGSRVRPGWATRRWPGSARGGRARRSRCG